MSQLPRDPLQPARNRQLIGVGIFFAVAGVSVTGFLAWLLSVAHALGRLGQLPVILLSAFFVILAVGCFDAAIAVLKKRERRRKHLLSTPALYVIGGLFCVFPLCFLVSGLIVQPEAGLRPALATAPFASFGVAALSLAILRGRKEST